jgi:hypothetical protein
MPRELFNSPEKQWIREEFWLPAIVDFKSRVATELKYLTFAGPKAFDVDFFTKKNIFLIGNVRVWEMNHNTATELKQKYGPGFNVVVGQASELARSAQERPNFPHTVINLDFTNGAFHLKKPWHVPPKFELIEKIILAQGECTESFLLLAAFAATADVDSDFGKAFVHKLAFDIATRFGHTEPLFNLTREPVKSYPQVLASIIPCAVIRLGGEQLYDTSCVGKALYFPYNSRKTAIVCFSFILTYDNPALSETLHQSSKRMDEVVLKRQEESLRVPLLEVNKLLRPKTVGRKKPPA